MSMKSNSELSQPKSNGGKQKRKTKKQKKNKKKTKKKNSEIKVNFLKWTKRFVPTVMYFTGKCFVVSNNHISKLKKT